jgi:MarR family 2-MHQ and catechol resistance regulon transcriptional repressor
MPDLTNQERLALGTYVKLIRASEAATMRIHRHLAETRLTFSQFGVLEALLYLGPLCQKDLGEKILRSSGNITLVVDNLERRDLVRRERSSADRRFVAVSLTEKGRRLIEELFPRHAQAAVGEMAVLTPAEQEELGRLCRKLGKQEKTG